MAVNQKVQSSNHIWGAKHLPHELSALLVDCATAWTCRNWPNTAGMRLSRRRSNVTGGSLTEPPMTFQGKFLSLSPRRALLVNGRVLQSAHSILRLAYLPYLSVVASAFNGSETKQLALFI